MANQQPTLLIPPGEYTQLIQARVPLDQAAQVFAMRDATGRIPIAVVPEHLNRTRNGMTTLGIILVVAGMAAGPFLPNAWVIMSLAGTIGAFLIILGLYRAFIVRIPEGANGLLTVNGRYIRTVASGTHLIAPWVIVTHLVTRREIPFDVPVVEALTQDSVRASVDTLITFSITSPYHFVYNISADDFDQIFQAICQDRLRALIRKITSDQVNELDQQNLSALQAELSAAVESYGVTVKKVTITYAQPPAEFMRSQEARQLAIIQQAEQTELQALALHRQNDLAELARLEVIARVDREREGRRELEEQAAAKRRVVELEAEAEALRLAKLEERLAQYPLATQYETEMARLQVARALAGNTRAVLQFGSANDITRAFVMRDVFQEGSGPLVTPPGFPDPNGQPAESRLGES